MDALLTLLLKVMCVKDDGAIMPKCIYFFICFEPPRSYEVLAEVEGKRITCINTTALIFPPVITCSSLFKIPVMAAIAVRKTAVSIGHLPPSFHLQSLNFF